jgi:hypothetical protein
MGLLNPIDVIAITMSSNHPPMPKFNISESFASYCVDKNLTTVCSTVYEKKPWIKLQLPKGQYVRKVLIFNYGPLYWRLANYMVVLSVSSFNSVDNLTYMGPSINGLNRKTFIEEIEILDCALETSYITLTLAGSQYLNIREITVFGENKPCMFTATMSYVQKQQEFYPTNSNSAIQIGVTNATTSIGLYVILSWISKIPAVANVTHRIHKFIFRIPTDSERIESIELQNHTIVETLETIVHSITGEQENDENGGEITSTTIVSLDLR